MNTHDIELTLRKLRLSGMAETLQTRALQAQAAQEPFMDTLAALLQDELDRRRSRLMARRFKLSGLDERPTLVDFDWQFNPKLPRAACFELHTLKFVAELQHVLGKLPHQVSARQVTLVLIVCVVVKGQREPSYVTGLIYYTIER